MAQDNRFVTMSVDDAEPVMLRPPGCVSDSALSELCDSCGDCVTACPYALISLQDNGHPVLGLQRRCAECGLCAEACTRGAIEFTEATWAGRERLRGSEHSKGHFVLLDPGRRKT